jgi:hypothetical protein
MFFHLNACSARGVVNQNAFDDGQFRSENDLGRARNPARRTDALKQALVLHGRILLLKIHDNATARHTGRWSIRTSPGIIARHGRHDGFRKIYSQVLLNRVHRPRRNFPVAFTSA